MFTTLIPCDALYDLLRDTDLVVVDCRFSLADTEKGLKAYLEAHIPGAFYAHLEEDLSGEVIAGKTGRHPLPDPAEFGQLLSQWGVNKESQVVAYDDMSGAIASRLWWMLRWVGHEQVAVLDGGWQAWLDKNFPVSSALPESRSGSIHIQERPDKIVNVDEVEKRRTDPNYKVVDSRTSERYRGEMEPIDPIAGHIPGAVNIPHPSVVDKEGLWMKEEELKTWYTNVLGETPAGNTIFYCGSGVTACRNILAFEHAGLGEAKLFPGSWSEWITNEDRPVGQKSD